MTIQDLGAIGEFLGLFVILLTLFYLARQTHQNVELNRAREQRTIIDQFNSYVRVMTDPDTLDAIRKGLDSYKSLDPNTQAIAWRTFAQWVNFYEQCDYTFQGGLLPKAILDAVEAFVLAILVTPGGLEYWELHGNSHGADVHEKLSRLLYDTDNLPDPVTETYRWLGIVN
jgi:hypothetical protein